jgi:hypothetical protein
VIALAACAAVAQAQAQPSEAKPITFPKIDRRPPPFQQPWLKAPMRLEQFPRFDPNSIEPFQVDLRGRNLSALDLTGRKADLEQADFDTRTIWPPADKLPPGFDPRRILELGKIPGLGVRSLHARGVTGRGVGIAMVDQLLLVDHHEYADRLRLYEEIGVTVLERTAPLHGAAVASIAVGKTVGVAPEADLYYIGSSLGLRGLPTNFRFYASGVRRVLKINDQLPADRKIRVIAIQVGWDRSQWGFADMNAACAEARSAGLLTTTSSAARGAGAGRSRSSPGLTPWRRKSSRRSPRSGSGPWR